MKLCNLNWPDDERVPPQKLRLPAELVIHHEQHCAVFHGFPKAKLKHPCETVHDVDLSRPFHYSVLYIPGFHRKIAPARRRCIKACKSLR
jgi:hypothetical protein